MALNVPRAFTLIVILQLLQISYCQWPIDPPRCLCNFQTACSATNPCCSGLTCVRKVGVSQCLEDTSYLAKAQAGQCIETDIGYPCLKDTDCCNPAARCVDKFCTLHCHVPTANPTSVPTSPTVKPSITPTSVPTLTYYPSPTPSTAPSYIPSFLPSTSPSAIPTFAPTLTPTSPSVPPTLTPTSATPTLTPSFKPSSIAPSNTRAPTNTESPTITFKPSQYPSTKLPSLSPTFTLYPSTKPSLKPSAIPTISKAPVTIGPTNAPQFPPGPAAFTSDANPGVISGVVCGFIAVTAIIIFLLVRRRNSRSIVESKENVKHDSNLTSNITLWPSTKKLPPSNNSSNTDKSKGEPRLKRVSSGSASAPSTNSLPSTTETQKKLFQIGMNSGMNSGMKPISFGKKRQPTEITESTSVDASSNTTSNV